MKDDVCDIMVGGKDKEGKSNFINMGGSNEVSIRFPIRFDLQDPVDRVRQRLYLLNPVCIQFSSEFHDRFIDGSV